MTRHVRATGRCLCGAVTFVVTGELREVVNCHCVRCRRFTGHHMAATSTRTADLQVQDPSATLIWFDPVDDVSYGFCARCGSSLFWRSGDGQETSVCAGTLDPPTGLHTVEAWWVQDASDYHVRPDLPERSTE